MFDIETFDYSAEYEDGQRSAALVKCRECGEVIAKAYDLTGPWHSDPTLCFRCGFWTEKVRLHRQDPDHWFICEGYSFHIGPEDPANPFRGYGGRKATVIWPHDGTTVETTNLWSQGEVPPHFRKRLPDTAVLRWS